MLLNAGKYLNSISTCITASGSRLLTCISIIIVLFCQFTFASDFNTAEEKAKYLIYLRNNYPEMYTDFITRYDVFDFLDRAQSAIEALEFKNRPIEAYSWSVSTVADDAVKRIYDPNLIRHEISLLGQAKNFSSVTIADLIKESFQRAQKYEGIMAGIAQTDSELGLKAILSLNAEDRYAKLEEKVKDLSVVPKINPKLLGIDKPSFSGPELLQLLRDAQTGRRDLARLMWLIQLTSDIPDYHLKKAEELSKYAQGLSNNRINSALGKKIEIDTITELIISKINKAGVLKILKIFEDESAKMSTKTERISQSKLLFVASRSHPYVAFPRGFVGDCSTTNCFGIPLVKGEEFFWIYKPDGTVKGYFQFSRVTVEGRPALYLNTISGAGISRADAEAVFHAVAVSLKELRAEKIVVPVVEKIPFIINFPEIKDVFHQLSTTGKKVKLNYSDEAERLKLLPFTDDSLDLPETNKEAVEVDLKQVLSFDVKVKMKRNQIAPDEAFTSVKQADIILLALEMRGREGNLEGIDGLLKLYNIDKVLFEKLWQVVSNADKQNVDEFHDRIGKSLTMLGIDFNKVKGSFFSSPLLLKGHMQAPDALKNSNGTLAMKYLQSLIMGFTDIPSIYETLGQNYERLAQHKPFVDLIKKLFKKNFKELNRQLDHYELEHRSAYRTLVFLFESGLPADSFQTEVAELLQQHENRVADPLLAHGIFFRRTTLAGVISNYQGVHFDNVISRLEQIARTSKTLNVDDMITVTSYFANASNKGKLSELQMARMEKFFMNSDFGMSFLPHLGMYSIEKINVPKLTDALLANGRYQWAAQLIYQGPWLRHPKAQLWMEQILNNKEQLSVELILLGFRLNPSMLTIPGIEKFVDDLMVRSAGNSQYEMAIAKIILGQPQRMTEARMKWLDSLKNPDIQTKVKHFKRQNKTLRSKKLVVSKGNACHAFYAQ